MADIKAIMERIPTVARLYYSGVGARRYRRASVLNGPGEPLVHRSHVERELQRLAPSAGMAAEYQAWIDFWHAGQGDYADFMRKRLPAEGASGVAVLGEPSEDHYNDLRELADEVRGMKRPLGVKGTVQNRMADALAKLICEPGKPEYLDQARAVLAEHMNSADGVRGTGGSNGR